MTQRERQTRRRNENTGIKIVWERERDGKYSAREKEDRRERRYGERKK